MPLPSRRCATGPARATGLLVWVLAGCGGVPADEGGRDSAERRAPPTVEATSLRRWARDTVWLPTPPAHPPAAYLSRGSQRVYVALDVRDGVHRVLDAYVSVSTGLWRIRFPADDPRVPIMPDDEAREFEETPFDAWDPTAPPHLGDVRVLRGDGERPRLRGACVPVEDETAWASLPTLEPGPPPEGGGDLVSETFGALGDVTLHGGPGCEGPGRTVVLLTWATHVDLPPPPPILRR